MAHSTRGTSRSKHQSAKPYKTYPLTAHPSGRWCKKIRGRIIFFGKIIPKDGGASAQAALDKYLRERDYHETGRVPPPDPKDVLTLAGLCNAFLTHQRNKMHSGELTSRTFGENYRTCEKMLAHFRKSRAADDVRQPDFAAYRVQLAQGCGPVTLGGEIQRVRSVFKYGFEAGLLDRPALFGPGFARPSKKTMRIERAKRGPKLFSREEILALLDVAKQPMKTMLLLALNAGLGAGDLANMPLAVVNLTTGWCNFPRPKTGVERRFRLWPETLQAVKEYIGKRPEPKDAANAGLLFITKYGGPWARSDFHEVPGEKLKTIVNNDNAIAKEFSKLAKAANIERRRGCGFYTMRHVFATIAGGSKDQIATNHIMGHIDATMSATYRQFVDDERLRAVAEHVRRWLFGTPAPEAEGGTQKPK